LALAKKRILVLGGGFAGVDCTRKLESYFHSDYNVEITLVSDDNFLLFTPMLPQVVAGTIAPRHIVMPLRALCKKARIYESVVRDIDPVQQHVTLEGTPEKIGVRIHYDYLVIALGGKTNFFGLKNVEKYSFTMKTLADAISLRNRLIDMLEQAENEKNPKIKKRLLTFVIVGGGFAGVETAGEINDFLHDAVSYYHNTEKDDIHVILVEVASTILQGFNKRLTEYAHNKLEKNGIKIILENAVTSFDGKNVILNKLSKPLSGIDSKNVIDSHTLVWTAGVIPVEIIQNSVFKIKKGKIIVNEFLEIPNHPGVFAIGDCSQFDDEVNDKFPPTAQLAEAHAKLVAYNIKQTIENKEKKKFVYNWKGQSAVIGKHYGIAEVMGMKITGFWAWVLWRNYYLTKMPNLEKRIRVWLDWNIDLFSRIDISRYGFKRDTSKEYRELDEVDDVW
jgi:NADH dehydrogenase